MKRAGNIGFRWGPEIGKLVGVETSSGSVWDTTSLRGRLRLGVANVAWLSLRLRDVEGPSLLSSATGLSCPMGSTLR